MRALVFALATLTATAAQAGWFDECQEDAARSASQPSAGVTRVVIIGRAGFLHIEGRAGASEIRASGTACAPTEEILAAIRLSATRSGSEVTVEAMIPKEDSSFFESSPHLDFTVTLPAGIEIDVADTSGELKVGNVGNARVTDTSGSIEIRKVTGNLSVTDTSGEIDIAGVTGDVHIPSDSSGGIEIRDVGGSVTIDEDSSGSIDVRKVKRNVVVGSDGSGSIFVSDVGGDFTLGRKGSGSVDYERVSGRISVPERHRR
jgi:hypothetical protein